MNSVMIEEVGIDSLDCLYVKPSGQKFEHIYRAALGVNWDNSKLILSSPKPKEKSHIDWFRQILFAVHDEYGILLQFTRDTRWVNISEILKSQIMSVTF